jgi:hypothetical protein
MALFLVGLFATRTGKALDWLVTIDSTQSKAGHTMAACAL